jgi:nicotinamide riboside kinase
LLTVVNWELYQSENQQLTSKSTSIQPATNQQLTTKQEGKECKELKSTPSGEVFNLPSKEELSESSKKKLRIDTDNLLKKLYDKKIFGKAHAFVNAMRKKQKNDRAILHALSRCYLKGINGKFKSDSDAWAYCQKIMNVENGNYNESDHQKTV